MQLNRFRNIILSCCLAFVLGLIFYANLQTILFADDFMYGIFLNDGFADFIRHNIWHFQNFNGRVFVHILVQITLVFDTYLFPFVNLAFLILIGVFLAKSQNEDSELTSFIIFFTATFMLLDISILRESYLWISASFNYTLSTMMVALLLFMYKRQIQMMTLKWYMLLAAFLAGATTEQMGMTSVFLILTLMITHFKNSKTAIKISLALLAATLAGTMSIFISGATFGRLSGENVTVMSDVASFRVWEVIMMFLGRFDSISHVIYQANFGLIFAVFGTLVATITYVDKTLTPRLRVGFIYSAVVAILHFAPIIPHAAIVMATLSVVFFLIVTIVLLKDKAYVFSAILIVSALFSLFVMLFTNSHEPRTAFPAILLIIGVCASFIAKFKSKQVYILPAYAIVCCLIFLPVVSGLRENRQIMNENIARINSADQNDGVILYNINFIDSHRHFMAHDDGFFYQYFRAYYRIADDTRIYFFSDVNPSIYTRDGTRIRMPARYVDDGVLMPFALVVTALGGSLEWTPEYTYLEFNDTKFRLNNNTNIITLTKGEEILEYNLAGRVVRGLHTFWYAEDIAKVFGVDFEFSGGRYIVSLS